MRTNYSDNGIMVQPYMMGELSSLYKVSPKTFKNWMVKIESKLGERCGRYYSARQVEIIFKIFGVPYKIEEIIINETKF